MIGYQGYVDRLRDDIEKAVDGLDIPGAQISGELRGELVQTVLLMNSWITQRDRRLFVDNID